MTTAQTVLSIREIEKVWYDCYGEEFRKEYPGVYKELMKLAENKTNTDKIEQIGNRTCACGGTCRTKIARPKMGGTKS